jgi:exosortase
VKTELTERPIPLTAGISVSGFLRQWWWLAAAFILVYGQIMRPLMQEWWTNEDYAHGLFTPFAVAYLVYDRRKELFNIHPSPSAFGLIVILASQALLLVGFLGAEFFLQRISMLLFIAGLIQYVWGWRALTKTAFALVLFLLAIPLPAIVFNSFALPLQLLASSLAEGILDMLHVSVYREGNILQLPNGLLLNVTEACSGIRSLVSLIALAALTTMIPRFRRMHWGARIAFIMSSVPIALVANALRVTATGLLAFNFGVASAEGFLHSFTGAFVFVFAFAALFIEMVILQRFSSGKRVTS